MADRSDLLVEGYCFGSQADAQRAQAELKKAEFFESRLAGRNAQNVLAVYKFWMKKYLSLPQAGNI